MSKPRFTPLVEEILRAAGWFEGRVASEEQMDSWLVINWNPDNYTPMGYARITRKAWQILKEFGGLTIDPTGLNNGADPFTLEPRLIADSDINLSYDADLFPLGLRHSTDAGILDQALVINGEGQIWVHGEGEWLMGATIEEALESLILNRFNDECQNREPDGFEALRGKILNKIANREVELLGGNWPSQPPIVPFKSEPLKAIGDWKAEAARVARAFGVAEPCVFLGPQNWKMLHLAKADMNEWFKGEPILSGKEKLSVGYWLEGRDFRINTVGQSANTRVYLDWNGKIIIYYVLAPENVPSMAKGLFRLGLLSPQVEKALEISVSQHEKMEWALEGETHHEL